MENTPLVKFVRNHIFYILTSEDIEYFTDIMIDLTL